jgi:anthranilate synthase component 1
MWTPVVRTVLADLQKQSARSCELRRRARFCSESIEGGERIARYSFIGANPFMVVRAQDGQTIVDRDGRREVLDQQGFEFLRQYFANKHLANRPGLAPLAGGAVGYLAYDAARWFEPVLNKSRQKATVADAAWMFFRNVIAFDRLRQQMEMRASCSSMKPAATDQKLRELYEQALAETAEIERQLNRELVANDAKPGCDSAERNIESNWSRADFEAAVDRVKEHIAAGDCYQTVIAQQFSKPTCASPLALYRALRATNPSPYMYFLRLGDESIIGASPEMLVRCSNRALEYRPIAGTRRRGETEADDLRLGEEMRHDEKEVAEHVMLVDLGRNDLGRVSEYGSVSVEQLMFIERYSHVQHLVSSVHSRLRIDLDRFDALAACFPRHGYWRAKIRAMQIIDKPSRQRGNAGAVSWTTRTS